MTEAVLTLEGVSKSFGGMQVVKDVSFAVTRGRIHALIGPNGAGKTTVINLIAGNLKCDAGVVRIGSLDARSLGVDQRVQAGLGRTFQVPQLFNRMSVLDNVLCGFHLGIEVLSMRERIRAALGGSRDLMARAVSLLERVGLAERAGAEAGLLPFGLKGRLELARALANEPRLLLLDEPCAGLHVPEAEEFSLLLQGIASDGVDLLIVEHNMPFVLGLADQVTVLDAGQVIFDGAADVARTDPKVVDAYLGAEVAA